MGGTQIFDGRTGPNCKEGWPAGCFGWSGQQIRIGSPVPYLALSALLSARPCGEENRTMTSLVAGGLTWSAFYIGGRDDMQARSLERNDQRGCHGAVHNISMICPITAQRGT